MAKIIVESDKNGIYHFVLRRDTNRTVASSASIQNKAACKDAIALFREYGKDTFYWTNKRSKIAQYHYSEWEKNGVVVSTRMYANITDLAKALRLIRNEISFKTPVFYTNIQNPKHHEEAMDNTK